MRNHKLFFLTTFIFALFSTLAYSFEAEDINLHLLITEAETGFSPISYNNIVLFGYEANRPTRFVGLAFEHENYRIIHPLYKNNNDIFILDYRPENQERLVYRYVVDGLWTEDPNNTDIITDSKGIRLSVFNLPISEMAPEISSPTFINDRIQFTYRGESHSDVYLVGDFNRWDPFINPLQEIGNGIYQISIKVRPGQHYYNFIVDGQRVIDLVNPQRIYNYEGLQVSSFYY